MVGIVLATHGKLAEGFIDAVNIIMGEPKNMEVASLTTEGGVEVFSKDLKASVEKVSSKDGVLILTDLQFGTPYNRSVILSQSREFDFDIKVTSGVNLPIILEILAQRENYTIYELAQMVLTVGSAGINLYEDTDNNDCDDEDL